jgi:DNA-binding NtrC family response regulator
MRLVSLARRGRRQPSASDENFTEIGDILLLPRVLLCEHDSVLAGILKEVFADEQLDVTECASLDDIECALLEHPGAVVLTDSWTDCRAAELSAEELDGINRLGQRTGVVVATARSWAYKACDLGLRPEVTVIPKPYDLDELVEVLRAAVKHART